MTNSTLHCACAVLPQWWDGGCAACPCRRSPDCAAAPSPPGIWAEHSMWRKITSSQRSRYCRIKISTQSISQAFLYIFWRATVCSPLLHLYRPFCIFGICLDSNPELPSKQVRYQFSHSPHISLWYQLSHTWHLPTNLATHLPTNLASHLPTNLATHLPINLATPLPRT